MKQAYKKTCNRTRLPPSAFFHDQARNDGSDADDGRKSFHGSTREEIPPCGGAARHDEKRKGVTTPSGDFINSSATVLKVMQATLKMMQVILKMMQVVLKTMQAILESDAGRFKNDAGHFKNHLR